MNERTELDQIVDVNGNIHYLGSKIGEGGQGAVYRTKDPSLAIKLVTDSEGNPITDRSSRKKYIAQLERMRILPLPDMHLAKPVVLLAEPYVGYVMRLLSDMTSVQKSFIAPPQTNLSEFYLHSGGLRRRLIVLAKIAQLLNELHSIPLVYADISPGNIFVSSDLDSSEVWLIDADNLQYESKVGSFIYTPSFGAPEVVSEKSGVDTLTDVYSFAIMAYWILTQQHPFLGSAIEDSGGWDDDSDDEDMEEKAYRGELPWVNDSEDDSNSTNSGIPPSLVISKRLMQLFRATFEEGRLNPIKRPSIQLWINVLQQAADMTIACRECKSTYYVHSDLLACPFCKTKRPAFLYLQSRRWDPIVDNDVLKTGENVVWQKVIDIQKIGTTLQLNKHLFQPVLFEDDNPVVVEVEIYSKEILIIKPVVSYGNELNLFVAKPGSNQYGRLDKEIRLPWPKGDDTWHIHANRKETAHRVVTITLKDYK